MAAHRRLPTSLSLSPPPRISERREYLLIPPVCGDPSTDASRTRKIPRWQRGNWKRGKTGKINLSSLSWKPRRGNWRWKGGGGGGVGTDSFHWLWGKASVVNGWQRHLSRQWTPAVYIPTWRPQLPAINTRLSSPRALSLSAPGHFRWGGGLRFLKHQPWWFLPAFECVNDDEYQKRNEHWINGAEEEKNRDIGWKGGVDAYFKG